MQTSFMHPPFGFALFYLRSVAPAKDFIDKLTGKLTPRVTTGQIYWGAVPFVVIQLIMVGLIITFPGIVTGGLTKQATVNIDQIKIEMPAESTEPEEAPLMGGANSGTDEKDAGDAAKPAEPAPGSGAGKAAAGKK